MAKTKTTEAAPAQPIARLAPSRMPIVKSVAEEFDVSADQWRVLVEQIFPNAKTVEAIGMALSYCRARKLDIYKRPVHIVPMWSSVLGKMVETVWPGIAEIRTTAHRTGNYAGIDKVVWGDIIENTFTDQIEQWENNVKKLNTVSVDLDYPESAEVTVYRMVEGKRRAFTAEVFWEEAYATIGKSIIPNTMWQKRSRGQLAKCVEAAALRMAFPEELGNVYAAEEMEGRTIDSAVPAAVIDATPALSSNKNRPVVPEIPADEPQPSPPTDAKATTGADAGATDPGGGDFNDDDSGVGGEPLQPIIDAVVKTGVSMGLGTEAEFTEAQQQPKDVAFVPTGEITPEVQSQLEQLEGALLLAGDEPTLDEAFDEFDPQTKFADNQVATARAFQIKADALAKLHTKGRQQLEASGQGSFLDIPEVP